MPEPEAEGWVSAKFEYVVACQMYHPFKASDEPQIRDPAKAAASTRPYPYPYPTSTPTPNPNANANPHQVSAGSGWHCRTPV